MKKSNCCNASVNENNVCQECKEHCDEENNKLNTEETKQLLSKLIKTLIEDDEETRAFRIALAKIYKKICL